MGYSVRDYLKLLQSLLPKGKLWNLSETSWLGEFLYGSSDELSRIDSRTDDLINETLPSKVTELIDEWEKEFGLPEVGLELGSTIEERRAELIARFTLDGRQNKEYFIEIAVRLGLTITIEEYTPAWIGIVTVGEPCGDQSIIFYWTVQVEVEAGILPDITVLQLNINKYKPVHTIALFDFVGPGFGRGFDRGFDSIPFFDGAFYPGGFGPGFSEGFHNNVYYNGKNYTGGFNSGFSIGFDSYRGGGFFTDEFGDGFRRPS
jgi:uncharacterized protein YmfQ (DUF2313 family)